MDGQVENQEQEAKHKVKPTTITCKPSETEFKIIEQIKEKKGFESINDALKFCIRKTAEWEL